VPVRVLYRPASLPGVSVLRLASEGPLSRTVPDHFASVLHLSGRSEWTSCGRRWSSRPGTLGIKIPGELYAERAREGRAKLQVILFDEAAIALARAALGHRPVAPKLDGIDRGDPRVRALARLHACLLADGAAAPGLEDAYCEALAALVALTSDADPAPMHRSAWGIAVARARELLDARLTETVTLDELAVHARLDKYRLCRAFRDEFGLPPHAYVTHRRISLAQRLLARGVPQAEVAASVGLYDQSQLHRHFKRIVGVTPGAYADAMR
jgi:AraC-like DNA-binding protein